MSNEIECHHFVLLDATTRTRRLSKERLYDQGNAQLRAIRQNQLNPDIALANKLACALSLSKTRFNDLSWENRGMILIDDWDLETDSGFLLRTFQIGSATGSREHLFKTSAWRPLSQGSSQNDII